MGGFFSRSTNCEWLFQPSDPNTNISFVVSNMNVDCGEILRFYDGKSIFYLLSNILDILVKNKMSIVFYILLPIVKSVFVEFIFNVLLYCDFELE